jgi:hypothetical protein
MGTYPDPNAPNAHRSNAQVSPAIRANPHADTEQSRASNRKIDSKGITNLILARATQREGLAETRRFDGLT